jgi:diadenosine tetraphosphate (Ap4A) HIT family hydrolase
MDGVEGCLACDLAAGRRDLPGGRIHETAYWIVEHCVGPLGVGALLVKPARHVVSVGELNGGEAAELGPLLQRAAAVVNELSRPEQVYVGLWSHAGRKRVHIHFVVQPATTAAIESVGESARISRRRCWIEACFLRMTRSKSSPSVRVECSRGTQSPN